VTELVVRRLLVDLDQPVGRHWNGGDAFRTAFFDALSFSFPGGEQFFIDAVKRGVLQLGPEQRPRFEAEVRAFVGQEATHRRIHQRFNALREGQGLVNHWAGWIERRRRKLEALGADARAWVGATAATEHLTAILADYLFAHPQALAGAEARLVDLWLWHASEESEHRGTAFDLYLALGGSERWRRRLFFVVSFHFGVDLMRQTLANLWRDGSWWRASTWLGALRLLFGRAGLVPALAKPWWRYTAAGFHPSQADGAPAQRWLAEHAALAPPVVATPR